MATSLPPVKLSPNVWVDLYDATGISVGVQIVIQNIGSSEAELSESATEPSGNYGFNPVPPRNYVTSATTPVGVWAKSDTGTTLQVEVA